MKDKEYIEIEGIVVEALPDMHFRVKLPNGKVIKAFVSGKMRLNSIRVIPGDRVRIQISKYDPSQGRIVYRIS
ncbi:MAG TPA: translation initiation factor IF-1 [Caldisericia bacterium]|nr:translation initiation factor IF-1 [Caldisericia bacterium]HOL82628.1 translation initiation factor IF-1 [Caldisericia bacterium]HON83993.1 translation initiation factor IF-1 [Caldisericia bacterium]HPC56493.1 translation initiation factor IF-1 [Caldisericia bacterium]HPP43300.1 translation initiation factor IF-1 [Caldisericia bacterium]